MDSAAHSTLGYPEWLYQLERKLQDFTPSFPDVLDSAVFEQLAADAVVFRLVLSSKERHWILERLQQSIVLLQDWQKDRRGGNATSLKSLSLLSPLNSADNAGAAYGIANRMIRLAVRLMEHPNYTPAIGEDLGLVGEDSFLPTHEPLLLKPL